MNITQVFLLEISFTLAGYYLQAICSSVAYMNMLCVKVSTDAHLGRGRDTYSILKVKTYLYRPFALKLLQKGLNILKMPCIRSHIPCSTININAPDALLNNAKRYCFPIRLSDVILLTLCIMIKLEALVVPYVMPKSSKSIYWAP